MGKQKSGKQKIEYPSHELARVRVGTELQIRGALLIQIGKLVVEADGSRSIYAALEQASYMVKHDRPITYEGILDVEIDRLKQWALERVNAEVCG